MTRRTSCTLVGFAALLVLAASTVTAADPAYVAAGWVQGHNCDDGDVAITIQPGTGAGAIALTDDGCDQGTLFGPGECARTQSGGISCVKPWCIGCGELHIDAKGEFVYSVGDFLSLVYWGQVRPVA